MWGSSGPSDRTDENNCVWMYTNLYDLGKWANVRCTSKAGYICKSSFYPITSSHEILARYRHKYYTFSRQLISWAEARKRCQDLGDHSNLVVIQNINEQNFINSKLKEFGIIHELWIGVAAFEERFKFVDVDNNQTISWTNWAIKEPSYAKDQSCAITYPN